MRLMTTVTIAVTPVVMSSQVSRSVVGSPSRMYILTMWQVPCIRPPHNHGIAG